MKDRLTKEITYWDHRAEQLKLQEQAGKAERPAQLGRGPQARRRPAGAAAEAPGGADARSADLAAAAGGARRAAGRAGWACIAAMTGRHAAAADAPVDTQAVAARARAIVMEIERAPRLRADRPRVREARLRHREPRPRHRQAALHRGQGPRRRRGRRSPSPRTRSSTRSTSPTTSSWRIVEFLRRRHAPRPLPAPALPARAGLRRDQRELRLRRAAPARARALMSEDRTWLQGFVEQAIDKRMCVQIHCTTCGARSSVRDSGTVWEANRPVVSGRCLGMHRRWLSSWSA